jgi:hypothetical protein
MLEPVHFFPALGTLISIAVILLAAFFPSSFLWAVLAGILILLVMAVHGVIKYKDARVFIYIPLIVPVQIWGYGLGFISAFVKRVIFRKDEFTGFTKKYY